MSNIKNNPFFTDGDLNQDLVCREIIKSSIIKYSSVENTLYVYNGTCYVPVSDFVIEKRIRDLVGQAGRIKPNHIKSILDRIKHTHADRCFPDLSINEKGLLNLRNGILNVRTGKLLPHSPNTPFIYRNEINFDPSATCPKFMKFLDTVLVGDKDLLALIQEVSGACLLPGNPAQKAFVLLGVGKNGKSTYLYLLRKVLGDENVSSLSPSHFNDRFKVIMLRNKLANISDEAPVKSTINSEVFKNLVSDGMITVEQKNQPAFQFRNTAKIIFSCNDTPRFNDHTLGLERRLLPIPFNYILSDDEIIPEYEKKLEKELPGILNFAIEGLRRLQENDYLFTIGEASKKAKKELLQDSDPVVEFLNECEVKKSNSSVVEKSVLYKAYREYCQNNGHHACATNEFSKRMKNVFKDICEFRNTTGNRRLFWKGYKITLPSREEIYKSINDLDNTTDEKVGYFSDKKIDGLDDL